MRIPKNLSKFKNDKLSEADFSKVLWHLGNKEYRTIKKVYSRGWWIRRIKLPDGTFFSVSIGHVPRPYTSWFFIGEDLGEDPIKTLEERQEAKKKEMLTEGRLTFP